MLEHPKEWCLHNDQRDVRCQWREQMLTDMSQFISWGKKANAPKDHGK